MRKYRFYLQVLTLALAVSMVAGMLGTAAASSSQQAAAAPASAPASSAGVAGAPNSTGVPNNAGVGISTALQDQFNAQPAGTQLNYWIILKDQVDTSNNIPMTQWADKGWFVYNKLVNEANASQPAVRSQLDQLTAQGKVSDIKSFWIINSFVVKGDLSSAQTIATNSAVARVRDTGQYHIIDQPATLSSGAQQVVDQALAQSPDTIQHNISEVHAPQAWTAGFDGTGVVVGSMDTGTRWTHEALHARYRGVDNPPDPANIHDYNWFDGYNVFTIPTDNNGHGSHTMGTIIGTSPNPTYGNTGVAKGADWITVRICATSSCDLTPIMNGFQWTLAPTRVNGTQPRPDLRPRVSSNSWGNNTCSDTEFQAGVTNWVNAGIFPDFANGNAGPGAGTVGVPAAYPNSWGTGALDTSGGGSSWTIASFSSRGPSCYGGILKPQAIAPGVSICSSINSSDTSYSCSFSGTSMATPHVAGLIAILAQKNPSATINDITNAITSTAFFSPTWGARPNNDYGWGLIQADAALGAIGGGTPTPTVTGTPPTNTPTPTLTRTPTLTPTPCLSANVVQNPGFETGSFAPWVISDTNNTPTVVMTQAHSGTHSALMGALAAPEPLGNSTIYQTVTVPAGTSTLSYWYYPTTADTIAFDWQDAYVENTSGTILATVMHVDENTPAWTNKTFDMTPYAGQTVRLVFLVHEDGFGDITSMYVDDVAIQAPASCGTPTSTVTPGGPTNTPPATTSTPQPTATATASIPTPTQCPSSLGQPITIGLDNPAKVSVINAPANNAGAHFRSSGSHPSGVAGSTVPNGNINFVLDDGTQENAVGFNNGTVSFPAIWLNRFTPGTGNYPLTLNTISIQWPNPANAHVNLVGLTVDLLVYLDADGDGNPANAVQLAQVMSQTITVADGTTFQDFPINVNVPGPGDIYLGFSDTYNSNDTNPVSYPAGLDTNASQMHSWIAGQGTGNPDYNNLGNNSILETIDAAGLPGNWMIRASGTTGGSGCPTLTPTAAATATTTATPAPPTATSTAAAATATMTSTNTAVATSTMTATNTPAVTNTPMPSVTPTDCPNPFVDITGNIFYVAIHYLNCRGVVNGIDPSHYGPAGTSTRGQFAKVVVLGFGTPLFTPTTQDFVDVPPSYFAYVFIESGFHAGILSGFDPATCAAHGLGTPCYLPNLPITRAQLTKLVVNAGGYTLITPQGGIPDFVDVLPSNVFYVSIETAFHAGLVNGYPGHLFLPNQNIRRDQMAQIVYTGIINRPH